MKNKIIFLSYQPLTKKFYADFFIDDLIENGFNVEFWDLTPIYYPYLEMPGKIDTSIISEFTSLKDFEKRLKKENIKSTIFIPYMTYELKVLKLFRIFTKYNTTIAHFFHGQFPTPFKEKLTRRFLRNPLEFFNFKRIKIFITGRIKRIAYLCKKLNIIKEYDFVFADGNKAINSFKEKTNVIPINLNDYDNFLSLKNCDERIINSKYCVVLDEDHAYHPDVKMLGWKDIDPEEYYILLNNFLTKIETTFNIKIVIAASPKSNYTINPFNNRKIFNSKTNELVKDCEFSIAVASTSISYPILYKKPILFFSTDDIANCHNSYNILPQYFADYLGCKYYKLDEIKENDEIRINPVNEKRYNKYKYNYLTSEESENKLTKDIVIDFLKDYFAKKNK